MTGLDDAHERVARVRSRIRAAAERAGRSPSDITLVGVCKGQPAERVAAAVRAGVLDLGENYVKEARQRRARLGELLAGVPAHELPRWRMVGRLQRNKARAAVELFDWIESLDREALAVELDRRARGADKRLSVCLQVNLSDEPQKGGVPEAAVAQLLRACRSLEHLSVRGLMTVPAASSDPEQTRPAFARLRELRDHLRRDEEADELRELSMGMSSDFETAIEEGATIVRVGTALFGAREGGE